MSYNIGQFRRNMISDYAEDIPLSVGSNYDREIIIPYGGGSSKDSGIVNINNLETTKNYYLRFSLGNGTLTPFKIKLVDKNNLSNSMTLKTINHPQRGSFYEVVFSPNDNFYNTILFERIKNNNNWDSNEVVPIEWSKDKPLFQTLTNIINRLNGGKIQYIKKIGIQGPPGLLFCLNGEEITIGKTGIYELEDIDISSLGFVIKNTSPIPYEDAKDYFIMDYQY